MSAPLTPQRDAEARRHLDSLSLDRRTGVAEVFAKYATATDDIGQAALVHLQWALAELDRLRAELEKQTAVVAEFTAQRAQYITSILNCHPNNSHDYNRWQGHAAARRQLSERLGLPVAWPAEAAPTPSLGELAEQKHLMDERDHDFEHLADERPPEVTA